jgi:hypothetical protein
MNDERKDDAKIATKERPKLGLKYGGAPSQRPLPQAGSAK